MLLWHYRAGASGAFIHRLHVVLRVRQPQFTLCFKIAMLHRRFQLKPGLEDTCILDQSRGWMNPPSITSPLDLTQAPTQAASSSLTALELGLWWHSTQRCRLFAENRLRTQQLILPHLLQRQLHHRQRHQLQPLRPLPQEHRLLQCPLHRLPRRLPRRHRQWCRQRLLKQHSSQLLLQSTPRWHLKRQTSRRQFPHLRSRTQPPFSRM